MDIIHVRRFIFLFLFPLFLQKVYAFQKEEALSIWPDIGVQSITQDSSGILWLGTTEGLVRFNGVEAKLFENTGAKLNFQAIHTDSTGVIWLGQRCFFRFSPLSKKMSPIAVPEEISNGQTIFFIRQVSDSTLLCCGRTNLFLYHIRSDNWKKVQIPEKYPFNIFNFCTNSNFVHFVFDKNISSYRLIYKKDSVWLEPFCKTIAPQTISLSTSPAGTLIYCTAKGEISEIDKEGRKIPHLPPSGKKYAIATSRANICCLVGDSCALVYDLNSRKIINTIDLPPHNTINSLYIDHSMRCWIGAQNGLYSINLHPSPFKLYPEIDKALEKEEEKTLFSLTASAGEVWLALPRSGIFSRPVEEPQSSFTHLRDIPNLSSRFFSVMTDSLQQKWIGGSTLYHIDSEGKTREFRFWDNQPESLSGWVVWDLLCTRKGEVWVATGDGVSRHIKDSLFHRITRSTSLFNYKTWALAEDREGNIWMGMPTGITVWDRMHDSIGKIDLSAIIDSTNIPSIRDICVTSGNIYFAAEQQGLLKYEVRGKTFSSKLQGLFIASIQEGSEGLLWIGTSNGLLLYDPENDRQVLQFDVNDGLPGNRFVSNASLKLASGEFFFATYSGLVSFFPENISVSSPPPFPPLPEKINISGEYREIIPQETVKINKNDKAFLSAVVPHYTSPTRNRVAFRFAGQTQWQYAPAGEPIALPTTKKGIFTLQMQSVSSHGITSNSSFFTYRVYQPFNLLWNGWIIVFLLSITIVALYIRFYPRIKKKQPRHKYQKTGKNSIAIEEVDSCGLLASTIALLEKNRLFSDPGLQSYTIARKLGIGNTRFRALLREQHNCLFEDVLNNIRIEEAKKILSSEKATLYTIDAIAGMCGFNTRSSFYNNFKKITGTTPRSFLKQDKK